MESAQPPAAGPSAGSPYTVLRIKRKATEPPLSSLVIHDSPSSHTGGRAKKRIAGLPSSKSRGFFRLAETVPETWEGRGVEGETLKERIKGLLSRRPAPTTPPITDPASSATSTGEGDGGGGAERPVPIPVPSTSPDPLHSPLSTSPRAVVIPANSNASSSVPPPNALNSAPSIPAPPPSSSAGPSSIPRRSSSIPAPSAQYRVIPPPSSSASRLGGMPPRLGTYADLEAKRLNLVFVDAQAVPSSSLPSSSPPDPSRGASPGEEEEMASFLPMLQEYLKLENASVDRQPPPPPEKEEWVYDLYYRDNRDPAELSLGAGDGVGPLNVGALLGYDTYSPPSTPSSSEPEDEADEDSNDEDFYRNDYPEDEDADEDMREYEAQLSDRDSEEEEWEREQHESGGGGGGVWDYR